MGEKDTKLDLVDEVTYDPTDDFSLNLSHYLPAAHIQAQRVKAQRAAASAEKAALRQQLWRKYRPLLLSGSGGGGTAAAGNGGSGSSSEGSSKSTGSGSAAASSSASSARSYSSSSSSPTGVQQAVSCMSLLMLCSSNRTIMAGSTSCTQQFQQRLRWCGLAAAPLLL